jgi:hypothetical protein
MPLQYIFYLTVFFCYWVEEGKIKKYVPHNYLGAVKTGGKKKEKPAFKQSFVT